MLNRADSLSPELALLLACCRVRIGADGAAAIRRMLNHGIDWTAFSRKAVAHNLAPLAGHSLVDAAPDLVPDDILDAFRWQIDRARQKNLLLFAELTLILDQLADHRIEAIPSRGPILAVNAYGDLGLRVCRDLDFLVRDADIAGALTVLRRRGYQRERRLTDEQVAAIQRLQGKDILFNQSAGITVSIHTRLAPAKMALDIDYGALWRRARPAVRNGHRMLALAPEDTLLMLAINGGKEMWWNVKWACDVAAFIEAHAALDWTAIVARARGQGCLRVTQLAIALVRQFFDAQLPDTILEHPDPSLGRIIATVVRQWQGDEPSGSLKTLPLDRLRMHDGVVRRAHYVARTLLLPDPHHVAAIALPRRMNAAYIPFKIAYDLVAMPLWRLYRKVAEAAARVQNHLAGHDLLNRIVPLPGPTRQAYAHWRKVRAAATRAVKENPNNVAAWQKLGDAMLGLKRFNDAIAGYDKAVTLAPSNRAIWKKRAATIKAAGEQFSLPDVALDPKDAAGWAVRAGGLAHMQRFEQAVAASDHALKLDPDHPAALHIGLRSRLHSCDWRRADDMRRITDALQAGSCLIGPSDHISLNNSEAENRLVAQWLARSIPAYKPMWNGERFQHDRIRIAYVSADLHAHATAFLMAGVFEEHDRSKFDTHAVSLGGSDGSEMRQRVESAFGKFFNAQSMSGSEIATLLRDLEIDIAVDLKGYTAGSRPDVFARRPAPVQVNYLGYPGTMGVSFMDYILADRIVIPEKNQIHYSEKVVYLPHSYQPNDCRRLRPEMCPSRAEVGLPENGFIFACLNNNYKIRPGIFAVWMNILRRVDDGVLWLFEDNEAASHNLRREAAERGISPNRLVFAPRVSPLKHLARQPLADLFLDTLPYNAHTTASDALWMGLPVLTCAGQTFPARVAASLLLAVGLPELVTETPAKYEALAVALAHDAGRLAAVTATLRRNRDTAPLFDTRRFTRDLEMAYAEMWRRQMSGLAPASFAVEESGSSAVNVNN